MRTTLLSLALALGLSVPGLALAQANPYYPLQGVLFDSAGAEINGTLSVEFNLYLNETGGTALWTETSNVDFADGLFSIYLGEVTPLDPSLFADNDGLWLGITVATDPEMDRVFLGSTPYSAYAEHVGEVDASAVVGVMSSSQLPTNLAEGPQGCPGGSGAVGIDVTGNLTCSPGPTGADFAYSSQSCPAGQRAIGIDATGALQCETPFASFSCGVGDVVVGWDASGDPICDAIDSALGGGTGPIALGSDVEITGDLNITGSLTVGGQTLGYPTGPQLFLGREDTFCTASSGNNVGYVTWPERFATPPVFMGTPDESLNNSGAIWTRLHQLENNRAGVRCNSNLDAYGWMAIEAGTWTIDQKMVQAGTVTGPVTNGQAVFFNQIFAQPPVVLLMIDETGNQSGAAYTRIINNVTTGGFEIWADATMDNLHWIAMDPGDYTYGPWHWYADVYVASGNTCSTNCSYSFPTGTFSEAPTILGTINDVNNSGGSQLRVRGLTQTGVNWYVNSATERIHYLAWEKN